MPAGNQDLSFDPDALREKYAHERDRRLRPDGIDQYVEIGVPSPPSPTTRGPIRTSRASRSPTT
jgi:hypothetical protein